MKLDEETLKLQDNCEFLRFLQTKRSQVKEQEEGEITLNLEAAQSKLGRFRLPRESSWILKFVQCANALEAKRLEIRSCRRWVEVCLPNPGLPPLEKLKLGLETLTSCSLPEEHLRAALLALRYKPGTLTVQYGGMRWEGEELTEVESEEQSPKFVCRYEHPGLGAFWSWLRARLGVASDLYGELFRYAYLTPATVLLDNNIVHRDPPPIILLNGILNDRSGLTLRVEGDILWGKNWDYEVFSHWARNSSRTFSYVVRVDFVGPGRREDVSLEWVRDGVVVERETHDVYSRGGVQVRVLLPADHLPTDLSGLSLQQNEDLLWRRRRGSFYARHALQELRQRLEEPDCWQRFVHHVQPGVSVKRETLVEEIGKLQCLFEPREDAATA